MRRLRWGMVVWTVGMVALTVFLSAPWVASQWAEIFTNKIKQADTTKPISIETDGDGVRIGTPTTPGTPIKQAVLYTASLQPTQIAVGLGPWMMATMAQQTFTVNGLDVTDIVFVNGPSLTNRDAATPCSALGAARVSAANTLQLTFLKQTSLACTPATGTYTIFAIRT